MKAIVDGIFYGCFNKRAGVPFLIKILAVVFIVICLATPIFIKEIINLFVK
jgi:hypothetical protein